MLIFLLMRLIPGDAATTMLGEDATPQAVAALREDLGLNKPWPTQYVDWLNGVIHGDLGTSYVGGYDIGAQIIQRGGLTLALAVSALILGSLLALAAGVYSALHSGKLRGEAVDVVAQLGIAVPPFWVGLVLIGIVSISLGWLPAGGYVPLSEDPVASIRSLILPVVTLTVSIAPALTRFVRFSMAEVLEEDYIRTAVAKGRTMRAAALNHGVRNASIPLVTVLVLAAGGLLTGTVIVEAVFSLPGLGSMLLDAALKREIIVVQSLTFVLLLAVLFLNFIMDILYGVLDPRIRDRGQLSNVG